MKLEGVVCGTFGLSSFLTENRYLENNAEEKEWKMQIELIVFRPESS